MACINMSDTHNIVYEIEPNISTLMDRIFDVLGTDILCL